MKRLRMLLVTTAFWGLGQALTAATEGNLPFDRLTQKAIASRSAHIDRLVEAGLAEAKVSPSPASPDEVFLRRIYLDVIGRIPTSAEAREFLDSPAADKRGALIDRLLQSEGYVSHQFNYFADLLRATTRLRRGSGKPYLDWIKRSLQTNKPFDQFVRELLTAEGNLFEPDNGAVGYYLRDFGMIEDNMSNTVRVFLGTRLECAQCHDHPFDDWTQRQYMEMVAYTAGVRPGPQLSRAERAEQKALFEQRGLDREMQRAYRRVTEPLAQSVGGVGDGLYHLPKSYAYPDGEPLEQVKAATIFGPDVNLPFVEFPARRRARDGVPARRKAEAQQRPTPKYRRVDLDSREAYARWMTSPRNPRFATVIANRLWKKVMGLGLIEPVDDLTEHTRASNPDLMAYLSEQMVALDYDLKQFMRMLFLTQHYQRSAVGSDAASAGRSVTLAGPLLRRMSAEQLWDSLATLSVEDVDTLSWERDTEVYDEYQALKRSDLDTRVEMAGAYLERRKQGKAPMAQRKKRTEQAAMERKREQTRMQAVRRAFKRAEWAGDRERMAEIGEGLAEMGLFLDADNRIRAARSGYTRFIQRASELNSPERGGHLLRAFGQSDREQIEAAHRDPSTPQILSLLNGYVDERLINSTATRLLQTVLKEEDPRERIDQIYLATYSRSPTQEEMEQGLRVADEDKRHGYQDLIWSQINSLEFLFVQ